MRRMRCLQFKSSIAEARNLGHDRGNLESSSSSSTETKSVSRGIREPEPKSERITDFASSVPEKYPAAPSAETRSCRSPYRSGAKTPYGSN